MKRLLVAGSVLVLAALLAALAMSNGGEERGEREAGEDRKGSGPGGAVEYGPGRLLCWAADRGIDESSGLAASRTTRGVFWTHNDSGGRPRLYAFDSRGNMLGRFAVDGRNRDWEDLCAYRRKGRGYLVVADTGDNARRRRDYRIYVCREPGFSAGGEGQPLKAAGDLKTVESFSFTYGDGQSHDGESIAATPDGRVLYIVTRNRRKARCKAFRLDRYAAATGDELKAEVTAEEIAVLKYANVSALDISPDGRRMLVHTYRDGYEFSRKSEETWQQALGRKPRRIRFPGDAPRVKPEGCSYGIDGVNIYLTSEHRRGCPLFVVRPKM
jgi:hypothetical protein